MVLKEAHHLIAVRYPYFVYPNNKFYDNGNNIIVVLLKEEDKDNCDHKILKEIIIDDNQEQYKNKLKCCIEDFNHVISKENKKEAIAFVSNETYVIFEDNENENVYVCI